MSCLGLLAYVSLPVQSKEDCLNFKLSTNSQLIYLFVHTQTRSVSSDTAEKSERDYLTVNLAAKHVIKRPLNLNQLLLTKGNRQKNNFSHILRL